MEPLSKRQHTDYDDDDEDIPLSSLTKRQKIISKESDDDSDSNQPLISPISSSAETETIKKLGSNNVSIDREDLTLSRTIIDNVKGEFDSDTALPHMSSSSSSTRESKKKKVKKVKKIKSEEEDNNKIDITKDTSKKTKKAKKIKEEEEESDNKYKWWENDKDDDDTIKWTTLTHNGVIFPPDYEPLPSHIKLYYEGKPVELPSQAEEVAGFYAALLETDHGKNPVFQKNFFNDFLEVLKESGGTKNNIDVKDFNKCDFSKMYDYFELKKQEKKQLSAQEKKQIRLDREKFEEPFKFCEIDGRKEQVGNFKIEPPDLFRGRGAHPKTGKLKRRVYPEEVVLNLGKEAEIPKPPEGHQWGEIKHDNTVQWLAMWRENISNSFKYVRLAANSSFKGQSDFKKFEKARELKKHITAIRSDYRKNFKNKIMVERQKAVAIYLIDIFALRAGGEKSEDEADTVGCCSLRYEHVTLKPPQTVIFDFLGKDSIRYYQEVEVDKQVFKNLVIFKRAPKKPGDQLFDRLDPAVLNKHLQHYMPGLTAKVFRTYNASKTMQDQLDLIPNEGSVAEKLLKYNAANRTVAILCNHQKSVGKTHAQSVQKANEKLQEMEWEKIRLKKGIIQLDKKELKKDPKFFNEIGDMTDEDMKTIITRIAERDIERFERKFVRDNDKRKFDGEELLTDEDLKEWLDKVKEKRDGFLKEVETGKVELKPSLNTVEKIKTQIEKLDERIRNRSLQLRDKEDNSQVSLGTSKLNYIDPRLNVVFCKKYGVPIEKIFAKTMRDKFQWAIESVDENWRF